MVYLLNSNLEINKPVRVALQNIYGIGNETAARICDKAGIGKTIRLKQLSSYYLERVITLVNEEEKFGPVKKQEKRKNIQRLVKIGSYRGFRHTQGLPCRGQRTHGNSRTVRKNK